MVVTHGPLPCLLVDQIDVGRGNDDPNVVGSPERSPLSARGRYAPLRNRGPRMKTSLWDANLSVEGTPAFFWFFFVVLSAAVRAARLRDFPYCYYIGCSYYDHAFTQYMRKLLLPHHRSTPTDHPRRRNQNYLFENAIAERHNTT